MKYPFITFLDLGSNYENILSILFTQYINLNPLILYFNFTQICWSENSVNLLVLDVEGLMIRSQVHLKKWLEVDDF